MTHSSVFHNILNAYDANQDSYNINPFTIFDFFNKSDIRKIPSYQRSYSWESAQIKELLNDIRSISQKDNNSWFLGPIFSTKRAVSDNGSELLDGQQRITTILLILREVYNFDYFLDPAINLNEIESSVKSEFNLLKQAAGNCVFINKNGQYVPRFETEETSREYLNKIFKKAQNVSNKEEYKQQKKDFAEEGDQILKEKGSKTAKNLSEAINIITDWLQKEFLQNEMLDDYQLKLESFNEFVVSLLYKCWLIEIPLKNEKESINIFESINNRGKQLTLVDKIRFKTLTYLNESSESYQEDLIFVKDSWKSIYTSLESLSNSIDNSATIIASEDDFFQVYFNATTGDSLTSDSERMGAFENIIKTESSYSINESIRSFLSKILDILNLLKLINRPLEDHSWIKDQVNNTSIFPALTSSSSRTQFLEKTTALLHLSKSLITNLSKNSRILIFNLFEKIGNNNSLSSLQIGLFNINKIAFYIEVMQNQKSNITRNKYLKFIKEGKNIHNYYTTFFSTSNPTSADFGYISKENPLNFILNKVDSESKYILHFTAFLEDYNMLSAGRAIQHSKCHLEHLIPIKYIENWRSLNPCKKEDLIKELNLIQQYSHFESEIFNEEWFSYLRNQFMSLTKFDISDENSTQREESIIQFIGNKWVIEHSTNISISNSSFAIKKVKFLEVVGKVIIPSNNKPNIGIDSFDDFSYREVLKRSLSLLEIVYKNYSKGIDVL